MVTIAIPVLLLQHFGAGPSAVGGSFALLGAGAMGSGLLFGRMGSVGRERTLLTAGFGATVPAFMLLATAGTTWTVALGLFVIGMAQGPCDIGIFALRQRRTAPAWFGRAFAISASLNGIGYPIGAAIGGPVAARSPALAIEIGTVFVVLATLAAVAGIPREPPPTAGESLPAGA
jgi:predicted MFS family arabinose efflux permease